MSEHKLNREPPSGPRENFMIHEGDTGKSYPIRECTDEQLAKHFQIANQQHQKLIEQAIHCIGQGTNAAKAAAIIAYEIDRRQRSITIVGSLDGWPRQ